MKVAIAAVTTPVLALCVGCGSSAPSDRTPAKPPTPAHGSATASAPQGELVTAELVKMNGPDHGAPPTTFRPGHPTPRAAPAATRTTTGFQVQFASHATITTPTVYKHAVIVSGGFKSKELYAFHRTTGASLWALDLHDDGPSSAACERGVCVVSTESCTLFALHAETGKHLWSYWLGDPLTSAPTIAGDRVFASYPAAGAADGKPRPPGATHVLAAFELRSGKILWQKWLDGDVMSAPVAVGEFVYATTFNGTVIKFEQATGTIRYAMRAKATSAPVVQFDQHGVEQMYYTRRGESSAEAAEGAHEMLIRADHNDPKTRYGTARKKADYIDKRVQKDSAHAAKASAEDAANGFSSPPAAASIDFAGDTVGVGSVSAMQNFQGSRVVKLSDRSVNTMGDEVIATDAESGATLWSYKLAGDLKKQGGFLGTAPLAAGGSILVGTLDGNVIRLDQRSGKVIRSYPVGSKIRSQPVVDSGWIYVGTEDGRLLAIDTKDPTLTGWPTWGGNAQRTGIAGR